MDICSLRIDDGHECLRTRLRQGPGAVREVHQGGDKTFCRKDVAQKPNRFTSQVTFRKSLEVTVYLVLKKRRANMSENSQRARRIHRKRDDQTDATRESVRDQGCFQDRFMPVDDAPSFSEDRGSYKAVALTSVMSKWRASSMVPRLEKEDRT